MPRPFKVRIVEVGPRDGLQNEAVAVPTADKVRFIEALADSGLRSIEAGSFVSPKAVPSMADSAEVFRLLRREKGVKYSALVPNFKGYDAAIKAKVSEIAVFASASETFSQRNLQASIDQSLVTYGEICEEAIRSGMPVRGYVSCVAGCPYEGPIDRQAVIRVVHALLSIGCYEVSLGDTIGVGTPRTIERLLNDLLKTVPKQNLAVHFHDTWGQALANILVALDHDIGVIDSSAAGLGGCPYAPGATGNVATEDLLYMLNGMEIATGVDINKVAGAGREMCRVLNRKPASKAAMAMLARNQS